MYNMVFAQQRSFTKSVKKIILTDDIPLLGFKGEICFVKPGYAFNQLVPKRKALFYSDPNVPEFEESINKQELVKKQNQRRLEAFLDKLKTIKIIFEKQVSEINQNLTTEPLTSDEVLATLNQRYTMNIQEKDFKMEASVDSIGDHQVTASFYSEHFNKEFKFFVIVAIRPKKKNAQVNPKDKRKKKKAIIS